MHDRIRVLARERGVTLRAMAGEMGWQPNRLSRWARGEIAPTVEDVVRVAERLGTTAGWLIDGSDDHLGLSGAESIAVRIVRANKLTEDQVIRALTLPPVREPDGPAPGAFVVAPPPPAPPGQSSHRKAK